MKRTLKLLSLFLVLALSVGLTSCKDDDDPIIDAIFGALTANGSATETTTVLTLQFCVEIEGLTKSDITLTPGETGATLGELTAKGNGKYEIALTGIAATGKITLTVTKEGYKFTPAAKEVDIYFYKVPEVTKITFEELTPNGSETETTTMLTLQLSDEIEGFSKSNIEFIPLETGAALGELTAKGNGKYELELTDVTASGSIALHLKKEGYEFSPSGKQIRIYFYKKPEPIVYVAGYERNPTTGKNIATVWKDGVAQQLTNGEQLAYAYSIAVSDNNVYVAGIEADATTRQTVATLWKDGVAQQLTNGVMNAYAKSVAVSGGVMYVAGYEYNATLRNWVAMFWKDGVAQQLADEYSYANSIAVSGGVTYVAGYKIVTGKNIAMLWKDGVAQPLTDGTQQAYAQAVAVSNGVTHVAGQESNTTGKYSIMLWKDGVAQQFSNGEQHANASSIAVLGDDVYIAGYESDATTGKQVAMLWKNGAAQRLTNGEQDANATSIAILNNDVYVAGYERDSTTGNWIATVWKNGEVFKRLTDGKNNAQANSIFLVAPTEAQY